MFATVSSSSSRRRRAGARTGAHAAYQQAGRRRRPRGDALATRRSVRFATALAALALGLDRGIRGATVNAVVAAVGAAVAAASDVATGYSTTRAWGWWPCRRHGLPRRAVGPAAPNVFLAAAAAPSAALLMLRLSGRTSPALVAIAAVSLLAAVVTVAAMPLTVVGAALSTSALALLGTRPPRVDGRRRARTRSLARRSDGARRRGPRHPQRSRRRRRGSRRAGVLVVAARRTRTRRGRHLHRADRSGAAPAGRTHADADRRIPCSQADWRPRRPPSALAVRSDGTASARSPPHWSSSACWPCADPGWRRLSRMLDHLEYAALVAVVPAACWVGGAYAAVGGLRDERPPRRGPQPLRRVVAAAVWAAPIAAAVTPPTVDDAQLPPPARRTADADRTDRRVPAARPPADGHRRLSQTSPNSKRRGG